MNTSRLHLRSSATLAALILLAACGGSSEGAPDPTAPPPGADTTIAETTPPTDTTESSDAPTSVDSTTSSVPEESTTVADTTPDTEPDETTPVAPEPTDAFLPDDLGTRVDSAPGVTTPGEVIELLDNVWIFIPSELDPDDANVIPPLPEDLEILAAYAKAQSAYHDQASMNPVNPQPGEDFADSILDGGARLADVILAPLASAEQHLDLTDGIVLRPVVLADPRSDDEVFVFDCQLDGTVIVDNSDGSLAEGQVAGVKTFPQIASLVNVNGEWVVDRLTRDDRACS